MAQGHTDKRHLLYTCAFDIIKCLSPSTGCKTCRLSFAHVDAYHKQVRWRKRGVASALQYDNHFPRSLGVAALLMTHRCGTSGSSEHRLLVPVTQPRVMCSVLTAIRDGLDFSFRNGFAPLDEEQIENEGFASPKIPLHWAIIILLNFCVMLQSEKVVACAACSCSWSCPSSVGHMSPEL